MAIVITNDRHYSDIAEAIRSISGSSNTYTPPQMASAISSLSGTGLVSTSRIIVTAESGGVVTAASGTSAKRAHYANGKYTIYNCDIGTWTVRYIKNGVTSESIVIIPSEQQRFEYAISM